MNILRKKQQAGLGMIELMVTLAVSGTLAGLAMPAMKQMKQRQQMRTLAETVMTDLQQARHEAVLRGQGVQFRISQTKNGSCYVIYTGKQDECSCGDGNMPVCTGAGQVLKTEWIPKERQLSLKMNAPRMQFDSRQGTVTPTATIDITGSTGEGLRHVVAITGRIRSCTPSGNFGSIPNCSKQA